jgi:ectoine hydroxylase-related dioxygenase (phytanoyl-CoA dioxygenase family)
LRAQFDANGHVCARAVLAATQLTALSERVRMLFTSTRPRSRQVLYTDGIVPPDTPHLDRLMHQWLNPHTYGKGEGTDDLLAGPRTLASELLGAPAVLFQDLLLVKEPGQRRFPLHQDFPFWPLDRPAGLTCWIPLVQNEAIAGGLMLARGSHRLDVQPVVDLHRGTPQRQGLTLPPLDTYPLDCPCLAAGDALLFSPLIFHGSPPRRTAGRRIAWASTWVHPDVRWDHAAAPAHPINELTVDGARVGERL